MLTALPIIAQDASEEPAAGDPAPGDAAPAEEPPAMEEAPAEAVPLEEEDAELLPPSEDGLMPPDEIVPVEEVPFPGAVPVMTKDFAVTRDSGAADSNAVNLQGITVYRDERTSVREAPTAPPFAGAGVKLLEGLTTPDADGLRQLLETKYLQRNKPASFRDLELIVEDILAHYRDNHRPMTHVYIPKQPYGPVIRFAVIEGVVGNAFLLTESEIRGKDPAALTPIEKPFHARIDDDSSWWQSWYRDPYKSEDLARTLGPRLDAIRGRVVDTEELKVQLAAINRSPWARLNRPVEHPFRDVEVRFSPPAADVLGQTDLVFEVRDSRPLKFFAGYENNLTELLGEDRLFVGAAWYDAFLLGRDHQLGFQIFSALDPDELLGVSANYLIPWKGGSQFTEFFAAYAESSAGISIAGVSSELEGANLILGARHYIELPELFGASDFSQPLGEKRPHQWAKPEREAFGLHHEAGIGLDYKATDNDLAFGGITAASNPADIVQLVLEYNARQTDPTGETNLGWQIFFSPGGITGNNDDESFAPLRYDSSASYFYTKLKLDREQDLPFGFMLRAGLTGQWSDGNLLASEQLGVGGYNSVRGYPERLHRGDTGYLFNLELFSPEFHPARDWFKLTKIDDRLRFLVFFDVGHGSAANENPADPLDDDSTLMSVGVGFRYEFRNDLRFRFDYGHQLKDPLPAVKNSDSGAFHVGLVWTF